MNCPVCKKPMMILEFEQIEIDYCCECSGIWLDEGELELLLENGQAKDELLQSLRIANNGSEKTRRCPRCTKKMEKVYAGSENNILLDKCKKNHGLWFDAGELHQVVSLGSADNNNKILKLLNEMFAYKLKSS